MIKFLPILLLTIILVTLACSTSKPTIRIDGSSTVFPLSEAAATRFIDTTEIIIGLSGTSGGFKKFCNGDTDINNASHPIKEIEKQNCKANEIEYVEIPIATDPLSIIVSSDSRMDFVESLTLEELNRVWKFDSNIIYWNQVRKDWPAEEIKFNSPGVDSGTFSYFTKEINGTDGEMRDVQIQSEDDNVIIRAVTEPYSIGYLGHSYYYFNKDIVKTVAIENKYPSDPAYPLRRPLYLYVNKETLQQPHVKNFVEYFQTPEAHQLIKDLGYIPN